MKHYFVKVNTYASETSRGFGNTWGVLVFSSKKARDEFVDKDSRLGTEAISKSEVTKVAANWHMGRNEYIKPRPFSRDYWGIRDYDADETTGYIGVVEVCTDGTMERLYK